MNRSMLEKVRASLVEQARLLTDTIAAIDEQLTALRSPRRRVLPPEEPGAPVDELAQERARRALRTRGIALEEQKP